MGKVWFCSFLFEEFLQGRGVWDLHSWQAGDTTLLLCFSCDQLLALVPLSCPETCFTTSLGGQDVRCPVKEGCRQWQSKSTNGSWAMIKPLFPSSLLCNTVPWNTKRLHMKCGGCSQGPLRVSPHTSHCWNLPGPVRSSPDSHPQSSETQFCCHWEVSKPALASSQLLSRQQAADPEE